MKTPDFTTTILVDQPPSEVFKAVTNPRGWWSEQIEGTTNQLNGEFSYHYKDVHIAKMKLIEVVPDKKVVWLVMDNYFKFTEDHHEWKGNKIIFDITRKDNSTKLTFTQSGLVPKYECYDSCATAWTHYINNSLHRLITTGKGMPSAKESEFNEQILQQHNQ